MKDPILLDLPEELIGERVIVRPFRPGDGSALFEAVQGSREHILAWLPWGDQHQTIEESELLVRRWDANWRLRESLNAAVWDRGTGRLLGGTGYPRLDWKVRRFEIGYWLRADATGKGLMTEAARLMCDFAFGPLEASRVIIRCFTDNVKSAAIPQRLGFVFEGALANDGVRADGTPADMLQFAMTPERWRARETGEGNVSV
jgi:RimJ/RimL family protein N-acetyltransferase